MKYKGSVSDYLEHRKRSIYETFKKVMTESPAGTIADDMYAVTAHSPAPRFWVSDTRAAIVIAKMERMEKLSAPATAAKWRSSIDAYNSQMARMLPMRRDMYEEIYRRYKQLRTKYPREPIIALVSRIIYAPAPSHYISPASLRNMIMECRKEKKTSIAR